LKQWSIDRKEGFLVHVEVQEAEANAQLKCIILLLRSAAPMSWKFAQINFEVGVRGSVLEGDLYAQ